VELPRVDRTTIRLLLCRRNFIGLWYLLDRSEENPPTRLLHNFYRVRTPSLTVQVQLPDRGDVNSLCTVLQ